MLKLNTQLGNIGLDGPSVLDEQVD